MPVLFPLLAMWESCVLHRVRGMHGGMSGHVGVLGYK